MENTKFRNEMCSCGHFGGHSIDSLQNHEPNFQLGHGKCTVPECECHWFTWVGMCDDKGVIEEITPASPSLSSNTDSWVNKKESWDLISYHIEQAKKMRMQN